MALRWIVDRPFLGIGRCLCFGVAVLAALLSMASSVAGQQETRTVVEVRGTSGDGQAYRLIRRGPSVTATITIFPGLPRKPFEVPEGFRPMTLIRRAPRGYKVLNDGAIVRSGVTVVVFVHPDGRLEFDGGFRESTAKGGYRLGDHQLTLEWFTATEEARGDFNNLAEHRDGYWELAKGGIFVQGRFSSSRSPVQHYAREQPTVLFTLPENYRPVVEVTRTALGHAVDAMGRPVEPAWTVPFRMVVSPEGSVRYRDNATLDDVGYLAFHLDLAWETAVSPDRAAMEVISQGLAVGAVDRAQVPHWGRADIPLNEWQGVSTDAVGRVTHLRWVGYDVGGHLPDAVGDLGALQVLRIGTSIGEIKFENRVLHTLCGLTNLRDLDLSYQPLEGQLPACWLQLENFEIPESAWHEGVGPFAAGVGRALATGNTQSNANRGVGHPAPRMACHGEPGKARFVQPESDG